MREQKPVIKAVPENIEEIKRSQLPEIDPHSAVARCHVDQMHHSISNIAPNDQGCQYGLGVLSRRRCRLIWTGRRPGTMWGAGLVGVLGSVLALGVPTSHSDNPTVWLADPRCVSLRECGAIGDGETDDTAAFVQCQQAAKAAGGCISVPSGTYACLAVPINTSHVEWRISAKATFVVPRNMSRINSMFLIGVDGGEPHAPPRTVANLSILGPIDASFTVDISKPTMVSSLCDWPRLRECDLVRTSSSTRTAIRILMRGFEKSDRNPLGLQRPPTHSTTKFLQAPWNVRGFIYMGDVSDFTLANVLIKMADPRLDPSISIVASKSGVSASLPPSTTRTSASTDSD